MRYAFLLPSMWLVLGSGCAAKPPDQTREQAISYYSVVLKSWDKDGDSRLSRVEVTAMVNEFFRRVAWDSSADKMTGDLEKQRQQSLRYYESQDTNRDGYLNLDELLKEPLASLDCMDENHDGKVTQDEVFSSMGGRCPSVNLDDYSPKR